jgi:hypothetical protein
MGRAQSALQRDCSLGWLALRTTTGTRGVDQDRESTLKVSPSSRQSFVIEHHPLKLPAPRIGGYAGTSS